MKYYITHFYNIRFFSPNCIPVSTAVSDPAYYHNNTKNNNLCFVDSRGVMNGIREESLSPKTLPSDAHVCTKNCEFSNLNPECPFLLAYREYLNTLDFEHLKRELERMAYEVQKILGFKEEPKIVLIVHEATDNPCSERKVLQDYFSEHGITLTEWIPEASGIIF